MTFLNLTFVKIMPSIYRLGAYAISVGVPNFADGEVALIFALWGVIMAHA